MQRKPKTNLTYIELASRKNRHAYHVALSDCLKPPVIHSVERSDGSVCVMASDNVMVTKVYVKVLDEEGKTLDEGPAVQAYPGSSPQRWEFATSAEGSLEATAWDLTQNRTMAYDQGS